MTWARWLRNDSDETSKSWPPYSRRFHTRSGRPGGPPKSMPRWLHGSRCRPEVAAASSTRTSGRFPTQGQRRQLDVETLVDLALVLDADDRERAHLGRVAHVRAPACLRIEALDLDHPDAAAGHRRLDLQRPQQVVSHTE